MHPLGAGRSPTDELERKTAHDTVYFTPPISAIGCFAYISIVSFKIYNEH